MPATEKVSYQQYVRNLRETLDEDEAMRLAIGDGDYEAFGVLQRELLKDVGLDDHGYLIELACGSGRLASKLSRSHGGKYLGIDIVEELLTYADRQCQREDWRFMEPLEPYTIPELDDVADMVCAFSLFTHLLHEHIYLYLRECKRVLKPGGRLVFSFLEFSMPSHWRVFEETVRNPDASILNQFISRDGIRAWAEHLGFQVIAIHDGEKPHFRLSEEVRFADGQVFKGLGHLGQSVCVLQKPH